MGTLFSIRTLKKSGPIRAGIILILGMTIFFLNFKSAEAEEGYVKDPQGPLPHDLIQPADMGAEKKLRHHPKMGFMVTPLTEAGEFSRDKMYPFSGDGELDIPTEKIQIQLTIDPENLIEVIDLIKTRGGEATGVGYKNALIQAWMPASAIEALAEHERIHFIRKPPKLHVSNNGFSSTEGIDAMNAAAWHDAGFKGGGVRIGIIDGGFQGYKGLLGGDLPASVTVKNFVDGETDIQVDGTTPHGTACAEIIHDIAPESAFYFAKVSTLIDTQEAVSWLTQSIHVDIISTSFGFFNVSPGDGTGVLADLVKDAHDTGVFWTTAAGNSRQLHWGGAYQDSDSDDWHEFSEGGEINFLVDPASRSPFFLPSGVLLTAFLRWDDWKYVDQDYELLAYRWDGVLLERVDWAYMSGGQDYQNGEAGQNPTEEINILTYGGPAAYGFVIGRHMATRKVNFELFVLGPGLALEWTLNRRSLSNLADAPHAVSVAALDVTAPFKIEFYSGQGMTNGPGGTANGGFIKPDISAFANVSTESYGFQGFRPFAGTSASTPHVAGAAALVLSARAGYTPDQLRSFLEARAIDMGNIGKDTKFGHGRLFLGDPVGQGDYEHIYFLPYAHSDSQHITSLCLRNCSPTEDSDVSVTFYDRGGNQVYSENDTISANGQAVYEYGDEVSDQGWIMVGSDQELVGVGYIETTGVRNHMAGVTLTSLLLTTSYLPDVMQTMEWDTTVYVCNPNDQTAKITLSYVDSQGNTIHSKKYNIPPRGRRAYPLASLTNGEEYDTGSIEILSNRGVAAFSFYSNLKSGGTFYTGFNAMAPTNE